MILCAFIMSFGACLNSDLQKSFEEIFGGYKKKFNIHYN